MPGILGAVATRTRDVPGMRRMAGMKGERDASGNFPGGNAGVNHVYAISQDKEMASESVPRCCEECEVASVSGERAGFLVRYWQETTIDRFGAGEMTDRVSNFAGRSVSQFRGARLLFPRYNERQFQFRKIVPSPSISRVPGVSGKGNRP